MATATKKTAKGLNLTCPFCGCSDESISLDLNNLDSITCGGCSEDFTVRLAIAQATKVLNQWQAVRRIVDLAEGIAEELRVNQD